MTVPLLPAYEITLKMKCHGKEIFRQGAEKDWESNGRI
jgi:hypothetical protein